MFSFRLSDEFVAGYRDRPVPWGFPDAAGNSLGEITFLRTYSRVKADGSKETWADVCRRVIEGMYSIQKDHCKGQRLPWNDHKAQRSAQDAFDRMFHFKWTPPGRGLWMMGTPLVMEHRNSAALQNCSAISTADMTRHDPARPFAFLMEASMLGIGVGFDDKGADKGFTIHNPPMPESVADATVYVIPDSREGWVESVVMQINSYLKPDQRFVEFDYSAIRPAGEPIRTFGGTAAGPEPLMRLHAAIRRQFAGRDGQPLTRTDIADIGNLIGVCVVSGNVRRSAELLMGRLDDEQFINLKNYDRNPQRAEWAWMSNNSVEVKVGDDLSHIIDGISRNGEPGVIWMDVTRRYGRLIDPPNDADWRAALYNPCHAGSVRLLTKEYGFQRFRWLNGREFHVWNGTDWSPSRAWHSGVKPVYRVNLTNGQHIELTEDHRLAVVVGEAEVEMAVRDLAVGQRIRPLLGDGWEGDAWIDHDFAVMIGLALGDGYLGGSKRTQTIYVKTSEQEVVDFAMKVSSVFDFGWTYQGDVLHLTGFREELRHLGFSITENLPERTLPESVFGSRPETVRAILRGLFSANGSAMPKHARISLKTTCRELADQVQLLLQALGYPAYITTNAASDVKWHNGTYTSRESYDVNIGAAWAYAKFQREIGFLHEHKSVPIPERPPRPPRATTVASIEYLGEMDVYDFVEPLTHWGMANGFKSHNCAEQSLESGECCTLVETYLNRHESLEDFKKTIKYAYLYAKTVTLLPTHWAETNAIMQRNRRIGTSMSGIANFADNRGMTELRQWMDEGYRTVRQYDRTYSEWLGIRESIKVTTVKPSGTVSILAGESPGVHWSPGGEFFDRAIRFSKDDPMVRLFRDAGYRVEKAVESPSTTVVVFFPIESSARRSERDVTIFEKANLAAMAQRYWSDNSVSVTLSFDKDAEGQHVGTVLHMHDGQLKTVSFLPMGDEAYEQMPYTRISDRQYEKSATRLRPVDLSSIYRGDALDALGEAYCTTDACEIPAKP